MEMQDAVDKSVVSEEEVVRLVCRGDASLGKGFPQFRRKALNSSSSVKWNPSTIEYADNAFLRSVAASPPEHRNH